MRRIIERVVTVVTTTTWTISWQDDSPHPASEVGSVDDNVSQSPSLTLAQQSDQINATQSTKEDQASKAKQ